MDGTVLQCSNPYRRSGVWELSLWTGRHCRVRGGRSTRMPRGPHLQQFPRQLCIPTSLGECISDEVCLVVTVASQDADLMWWKSQICFAGNLSGEDRVRTAETGLFWNWNLVLFKKCVPYRWTFLLETQSARRSKQD